MTHPKSHKDLFSSDRFPVFAPVVAIPDTAKYEQTNPYKPSGRLYRVSPIPAGADWTS